MLRAAPLTAPTATPPPPPPPPDRFRMSTCEAPANRARARQCHLRPRRPPTSPRPPPPPSPSTPCRPCRLRSRRWPAPPSTPQRSRRTFCLLRRRRPRPGSADAVNVQPHPRHTRRRLRRRPLSRRLPYRGLPLASRHRPRPQQPRRPCAASRCSHGRRRSHWPLHPSAPHPRPCDKPSSYPGSHRVRALYRRRALVHCRVRRLHLRPQSAMLCAGASTVVPCPSHPPAATDPSTTTVASTVTSETSETAATNDATTSSAKARPSSRPRRNGRRRSCSSGQWRRLRFASTVSSQRTTRSVRRMIGIPAKRPTGTMTGTGYVIGSGLLRGPREQREQRGEKRGMHEVGAARLSWWTSGQSSHWVAVHDRAGKTRMRWRSWPATGDASGAWPGRGMCHHPRWA